jgi:hypothetical protein
VRIYICFWQAFINSTQGNLKPYDKNNHRADASQSHAQVELLKNPSGY